MEREVELGLLVVLLACDSDGRVVADTGGLCVLPGDCEGVSGCFGFFVLGC